MICGERCEEDPEPWIRIFRLKTTSMITVALNMLESSAMLVVACEVDPLLDKDRKPYTT